MSKRILILALLCLMSNHVGYADAALRAHWAMDDAPGSNQAADSSGLGNPGTVLGNATFVAGRIGNALSMNGSGDHIDVPPDTGDGFDAFNLGTGSWTMALWANVTQLGSSNSNLLSFGDVGTLGGGVAEFSVRHSDGRLFGAWVAHDRPFAPPNDIADRSMDFVPSVPIFDRWAHLAMVRDVSQDSTTFYLDGQPQVTLSDVAGDMSFQNPAWGVIIGRGFFDPPNPNERPVVGLIDDVRIYDNALTQTEIQNLPGDVGGTGGAANTEFRWTSGSVGDWTVDGNWSPPLGAPPNNHQHTAIFGVEVTQPTTITTNAAVEVNRVVFDSTSTVAVAGLGSVNLIATTAPLDPTISVTGTHQFQAEVNLLDDTNVDVAGGSTLAFENDLNLMGNTLTKTGAGVLEINNRLTTAGGTVSVQQGTIAGVGTIGGDVNNGGGIISPGSGSGGSAIPEPTAALLFVLGTLGWLIRSRQAIR